ncbi:MAG: hypothetical protein OEU32_06405 [Acidimicrobiia bacterium]|nr:hypothetical protein [Acidimicrobiia bacterium]
MEQFFFGRYLKSDDPWFRVGQVDVTTTLLVVIMGFVSMFVWAAEGNLGPIFRHLWLLPEADGLGSAAEGEIWRLITWPIPNEPDLWTVVLFVIFFMLGSPLEAQMGRRRYTGYLVAVTVIPAVTVTIIELLGGFGVPQGGVGGLRFVEIGVLAAFAASFPKASFWPGIPAWAIAGIVALIQVLREIGDGSDFRLVVLCMAIVVAVLGIRALGLAEASSWIPKVPLPAALGGAPGQSSGRTSGRSKRRRRRSSGGLHAVPLHDQRRHDQEDREIDALLDLVARDGIESLTKQQRKRLEQLSRERRKRNQ